MVYCELLDSLTEDYGQRILRLSEKVMNLLEVEEDDIVEVIANRKRIGVIVKADLLLETVNNQVGFDPEATRTYIKGAR